jgi:adenosylmethionine-8-amino-7-oxononanoate aminotransferase
VPRPRPSRGDGALHEQLDSLAYAHTGFFTTEVAEKLATG